MRELVQDPRKQATESGEKKRATDSRGSQKTRKNKTRRNKERREHKGIEKERDRKIGQRGD